MPPLTRISRRRRLRRRALPLALLAFVALAAGLVVGALGGSEGREAGERYARAWSEGDLRGMYAELTPEAQDRTPFSRFAALYRRANAITTAVAVRTGRVREQGGFAVVPAAVRTRVFGTVRGELRLPIEDGKLSWQPNLVVPGLGSGERITRSTDAPPRARILTREGRTIAEGPAEARTSPLGAAGTAITGEVGEAETREQRSDLYARGFARDTPVGRTGLERLVERQVAGIPGGSLRLGGRVVARSEPRRANPVRTTIDVQVQEAAVEALVGRFGGIAALDPLTAEVRALAGVAFSAPQPPGSVFKIVTTTAALEGKYVRPTTRFPVETKAVLDGVDLENANGESCGGSFASSFAHSCNSVFAPLGARVGARRLVDAAERYGWNEKPSLPGALPSSIPAAGEIKGDLAVGSTAIGQGKVLATPLQMASVSQVIASDGMRREPTLLAGHRGRTTRVTDPRTARTIERLMVAVVSSGTGTAASLSPTKVAGKTGTAELRDTTAEPPPAPADPSQPAAPEKDVWFTAYAPIRRPRLAVAVMIVGGSSGGTDAAPRAKAVLQAGLASGGDSED